MCSHVMCLGQVQGCFFVNKPANDSRVFSFPAPCDIKLNTKCKHENKNKNQQLDINGLETKNPSLRIDTLKVVKYSIAKASLRLW